MSSRLVLAFLLASPACFGSAAPTTTSLTASPSPAIYGRQVTLTATVTPTPTSGTVTFYDGALVLGSTAVGTTTGIATFKTISLTAGPRKLTARYNGTVVFQASVSPAITETITTTAGDTFANAVSYTTDLYSNAVAVGDFNGDGKADLATANTGNSTISVLLGNGDGTFQPEVKYAATYAQNIIVCDCNGDGILDLAVTSNAKVVGLFFGKGDGTFLAPVALNFTFTPVAIYAADLNGDGIVDLITANAAPSGSGNISVLLGTGGGNFSAAVNYTARNFPAGLTVADFNRDGKLDIAIADSFGNEVDILFGNGDGSFQPIVTAATLPYPGSLAAVDFNHDGKMDLAVTTGNGYALMYGNGDGTFQPAQFYPTGLGMTGLVIADFNGDGIADLASSVNASTFSVLIGNADGTFQPSVLYGTTGGGTFLAAGDFNGDGRADLAIPQGNPGSVAIALGGSGNCSFAVSPQNFSFGGLGGNATATVTASGANTCSWGAGADAAFITSPAGSSATGSGTFTVTAAKNGTGVQQTGNVILGAQKFPLTQSAQSFQDVLPSDYFFLAVEKLSAQNITGGCGVTPPLYCPTQFVTRAQMAIFIVRAVYGSDNFTASQTPYFTDVPATTFGFQWIQKLYELGITAGCGNSQYCPNDSVTRAQMAIFIIRARYGSATTFDYNATPYFTDAPISTLGFAWIQRLKQDNITGGCGTNTYCPNDPVTRGDMAFFIMRGAFNQLLPATDPIIKSATPMPIGTRTTTVVTITGVNTHFVQGTTTINPIPGYTLGAITVTSPTTLTVPITAPNTANTTPQSIWVRTGNEEEVLPNVLTSQGFA